MTNAYYTPAQPDRKSRIRASEENADRLAVEDAFDKLPTEAEFKSGDVNWSGTATGSFGWYTIVQPNITAYTAGVRCSFIVPDDPLAGLWPHLTISAVDPAPEFIFRDDNAITIPEDLPEDNVADMIYDGDNWRLMSSALNQVTSLRVKSMLEFWGDTWAELETDPGKPTNTRLGVFALNAAGRVDGNNTAYGHYALGVLTTGTGNVGVGGRAGTSLITGSNNVYIGDECGYSPSADSAAFSNVVIGDSAGYASTLQDSVIVGSTAQQGNTSVTRSVILGYAAGQAGSFTDSVVLGGEAVSAGATQCVTIGSKAEGYGTGNVTIGYKANDTQSASESNKLTIANDTGTPLISGDFSTDELTITGHLEATKWFLAPTYTVAGAPSAVTAGAGAMIYVSDGDAGSATYAVSDGTNWKVVALGATVRIF